MRRAGHRQAVASEETSSGVAAFVARRRAGLGVVLVGVIGVVAGGFAWQRFGPDVRRRPEYLLQPENVALIGQPEWIKRDIAAEALRDASLDTSLPLDDPELARRLARAFDVHPWVRSVDHVVVSSPASARVTITCREPVAMVRVPGGLLPVDGEGVVLPSDDFTPEEAAGYPIVAGVSSLPQGPAGSAWGDPSVEEAIAVVAVTSPEWKPLNLVECRLAPSGDQRQWELVNADGIGITFGSSPGMEQPGETGMAEKIAMLKQIATIGPADEAIDLRNAAFQGEPDRSQPIETPSVDTAPVTDSTLSPP